MPATEITAKLAEIELTIPDIKRTFADAPNSIQPADMPAFYNITGRGVYFPAGTNIVREERTYLARLVLAPIGAGLAGDTDKLAKKMIPIVKEFFLSRNDFLGMDSVEFFSCLGDSGPKTSLIGRDAFVVIDFELNIHELLYLNYVAY